MPRRLIVLLTAAFVLVPAASAHAGWFPAAPIDGPNADVISVGNVDLARDGTGAVAYLKNGDGVPQACVSRIYGGALAAAGAHQLHGRRPSPRSRSRRATATGSRSPGSPTATSTPRSRPGGDTPGGFAPGGRARRAGRERRSTSTSASTAPPTRSGRRAATSPPRACRTRPGRASRRRWTSTPRREAGTGALRPRVAVSAEGYAVATWGERHARRLDARVGPPHHRHEPLDGPAGPRRSPGEGNADSPDIDIEDDGSYAWVVFRQDVGGTSRDARAAAGRLAVRGARVHRRGRAVDGPEGRHERRRAAATPSRRRRRARRSSAPGSTTTTSSPRRGWTASTASRRPSRRSPPTDRDDIAIAWRLTGADGNSVARARYHDGEDPNGALGAEVTVSRGDLGPVADPGVFDRRRPRRRLRGGDGPGHAGRADAGGRDLRPPAGRAVHRRASQAYKRKTRPGAALAARASSCGARRPSGSTWTASRSGRRPTTRSSRRRR